jgi:hypothetical protein
MALRHTVRLRHCKPPISPCLLSRRHKRDAGAMLLCVRCHCKIVRPPFLAARTRVAAVPISTDLTYSARDFKRAVGFLWPAPLPGWTM